MSTHLVVDQYDNKKYGPYGSEVEAQTAAKAKRTAWIDARSGDGNTYERHPSDETASGRYYVALAITTQTNIGDGINLDNVSRQEHACFTVETFSGL